MAKLQAYGLQDAGLDTVEANVELGLPVDSRDYSDAAAILVDLGIERLRLLSNNPAKWSALSEAGISVAERISYTTTIATECVSYLRTKRDRMGHDLPSVFEVQTLAGAL
ncbi:MAG: hypothetical protein ACRD3Q_11000 [Terriglobales bacterium]